MAEVELKNLKEAIIDLYLAIKIRSTEEVITISLLFLYFSNSSKKNLTKFLIS
jgi:hypothetical protein